MRFTNEQVENYLQILQTLPSSRIGTPPNRKVTCRNCQGDKFFVELGYNFCEEYGMSQGHALGFYDKRECERFHFRKKSIYQRKYHYEKKNAEISKKLFLTEEQKYCLYKKLMAIDRDKMEVLNKRFCRKRMISIYYLISKFLEGMKNKKI